MDKLEFNQLELQEQVQYINDQLTTTGLSVTKVCDAIGIDRSTLRKRFKKGGYLFNADINLYDTGMLKIDGDKKETNTSSRKTFNNTNNTTNTNQLETRMKALEMKVKALEELINSNSINSINADDKEVNITTFEGETVSRAYRLDAKIQKEFKIFCKKHSEYKVQDIISSALKDFMDKNK
ncbi:AraC family transcriptional regulator [Paraclostridium sordellii]|uniref:AraC family transcriptional regulator n=1 Tax=Paraclostridium sordellii TaxID=1505 RepID=UPI0005E9100A|nr:AraC family transcriptional regulator [Paeniclostridium sordellii]CEP44299.1 Hypothetical Protein R32921_33281 [[Clostridium] sordellii] [Paeniclostridium sordellii]